MSDAIVSSVVQSYEAGQYGLSGGVSISTRDDDVALAQQYSEAQLVGRALSASNTYANSNERDSSKQRTERNDFQDASTSDLSNDAVPQQQRLSASDADMQAIGSSGIQVGNTYADYVADVRTDAGSNARTYDVARPIRTGELRSCLSRSSGSQKRPGRRLRFPEDGPLVTGAMPPVDPWQTVKLCSTEELVNSYRLACESQSIRANPFVEEQLKTVSLHDVNERHGGLCLKNIKLDSRHCEALEQVLRRVRFVTLDLENTQLDDDAASMLFDMIEFYESAVRLSIAHNVRLTLRGWLACSRMLKMTQSIEYLDVRHCVFNEHTITVLARALKLVTHLSVLHLEHAGVSGRVLATLVAALRLNDTVRELYLSDNRLLPSDGVNLGSLLKFNRTVQLLDLRNNTLQDVGLMHLCDGLAEQTGEVGLRTLILWNNQITHYSMSAFGRALALAKCVESVNVGSNNVNNEGVHQLKEGLLKNKSLLHFGLKASKIGCEGAVALAEYIAECPQLQRIDLRGNDIRTGGLMALSLALRVNRTLQQIDLDREPKREPGVDDYALTQKRLLDSIAEYTERNVQIVKLKEEVKQLLERQAESVKQSGEHPPAVASESSEGAAETTVNAETSASTDNGAESAESRQPVDIGVGEESTTNVDDSCYPQSPLGDTEVCDAYATPKGNADDSVEASVKNENNADEEEEAGPDEDIVVLAEQVTGSEMTKATLEKHQKFGSPFRDDDTASSLSTSPRISAPALLANRHASCSSSGSPSTSPRSSLEPATAKVSIRELVSGNSAVSAPISVPQTSVLTSQRISSSFTPPTSPMEQTTGTRNRFSVSLVSPEELGVSRQKLREFAANARLKAAAATNAHTGVESEQQTPVPANEPVNAVQSADTVEASGNNEAVGDDAAFR